MHLHPAWKILNSLPLLGMQLVSAECCRKLLISLTVTLCANPVYKFAQIGGSSYGAREQQDDKTQSHLSPIAAGTAVFLLLSRFDQQVPEFVM
jgi:hypothetical protein